MQIIEMDVFLCCENCVRKVLKALEEMDGECLESLSFTIAIEGSLKISVSLSLSLSVIIFSPQLKDVCPMYIPPCDKHSRAYNLLDRRF
jgi:copper chaperone CopZ